MARRDWYCEDVLSGKLDVQRVYEDDRVLAFHHPRPVAKIHVVVVPKDHVASILEVARDEINLTLGRQWIDRVVFEEEDDNTLTAFECFFIWLKSLFLDRGSGRYRDCGELF